ERAREPAGDGAAREVAHDRARSPAHDLDRLHGGGRHARGRPARGRSSPPGRGHGLRRGPLNLGRAAFALLAAAPIAGAQESPAADVPAFRPRVALALSGGGARGIAHVGVLKAFEEEGIPVDAIAATSIGAVVGSIYATGSTASHLEETVKSLDWESIFSGEPDRRFVPLAHRDDRYRTVAGIGFDFWELRVPRGLL